MSTQHDGPVTQHHWPAPTALNDAVLRIGTDTGWELELLPARGLDIFEAAWRGHRMDWASQDGPIHAVSDADREQGCWIENFRGGLLVTCGLQNVGPPIGGYPLHGRYSLTPADDLHIATDTGPDVVVTGTVTDGPLTCRRVVSLTEHGTCIAVQDNVTNASDRPHYAPMLYHANFGGALVGPNSVVRVDTAGTRPRDADSDVCQGRWDHPASVQTDREVVLEHEIKPGSPRSVVIMDHQTGKGVQVSWTGLDRLHQWIDLTPGRGVLAIEPANCSLHGGAIDAPVNHAAWLEPEQTRHTGIEWRPVTE